MDTKLFLLALSIAVLGPVVAISYLRPILNKVLAGLCDADGGAEFWIRCAYLLAVSGTLVLMLVFGHFDSGHSIVDALRRALLLVVVGVFASVALISRNVWSQVNELLKRNRGSADDKELLTVPGDPS